MTHPGLVCPRDILASVESHGEDTFGIMRSPPLFIQSCDACACCNHAHFIEMNAL
jgi:hypothetical protein